MVPVKIIITNAFWFYIFLDFISMMVKKGLYMVYWYDWNIIKVG